ncbi:MAG TPA: type 1 glutamine amidotransferase, partial [Desulfobacteria bacterium]|nr:type 1 glutamine amidotransferase [Desulfobacteria bacterium]
FEDLANIMVWAEEKGHSVSSTKLYGNDTLPSIVQFDWLIVMGGPMNIYEEEEYHWMVSEKNFIKEAIQAGKIVLGICLGAQLIADVLGGKIIRNEYKEIGWFPVTKLKEADNSLLGPLPEQFLAFHWHGDTFEIPPGAIRLAESEACKNQAFQFGGRVLGLQFHLESSRVSIGRLAENCRDEITDGKFIQAEPLLLSNSEFLKNVYCSMNILLNEIESRFNKTNCLTSNH